MKVLQKLMRDAADKLQVAQEASNYLRNPPPDDYYGAQINWSWGAGTDGRGLNAIKVIVAREVNELLPQLIRRAVDELIVETTTATEKLKKALE